MSGKWISKIVLFLIPILILGCVSLPTSGGGGTGGAPGVFIESFNSDQPTIFPRETTGINLKISNGGEFVATDVKATIFGLGELNLYGADSTPSKILVDLDPADPATGTPSDKRETFWLVRAPADFSGTKGGTSGYKVGVRVDYMYGSDGWTEMLVTQKEQEQIKVQEGEMTSTAGGITRAPVETQVYAPKFLLYREILEVDNPVNARVDLVNSGGGTPFCNDVYDGDKHLYYACGLDFTIPTDFLTLDETVGSIIPVERISYQIDGGLSTGSMHTIDLRFEGNKLILDVDADSKVTKSLGTTYKLYTDSKPMRFGVGQSPLMAKVRNIILSTTAGPLVNLETKASGGNCAFGDSVGDARLSDIELCTGPHFGELGAGIKYYHFNPSQEEDLAFWRNSGPDIEFDGPFILRLILSDIQNTGWSCVGKEPTFGLCVRKESDGDINITGGIVGIPDTPQYTIDDIESGIWCCKADCDPDSESDREYLWRFKKEDKNIILTKSFNDALTSDSLELRGKGKYRSHVCWFKPVRDNIGPEEKIPLLASSTFGYSTKSELLLAVHGEAIEGSR